MTLTNNDLRTNSYNVFKQIATGRLVRLVSAEDTDDNCTVWFCAHEGPDETLFLRASEVELTTITL